MANAFALSRELVNSSSLRTGYYFTRLQKKKIPFKKGKKKNPTGDVNSFWSTRCQGEGREVNCRLQFQQEITGASLAAALGSRGAA